VPARRRKACLQPRVARAVALPTLVPQQEVGGGCVDTLTLDVKLLLVASLLAAWLGLRQHGNGSSMYALTFGALLFSAGLRYTGVWH
jgi:hypothetical protein